MNIDYKNITKNLYLKIENTIYKCFKLRTDLVPNIFLGYNSLTKQALASGYLKKKNTHFYILKS